MASASADPKPERRERARNLIVWIVSVLLALEFVFSSVPKLLANPIMVDMFNKVGLGLWFMYFTGVLEIVGAVGILIPRFSLQAACLLAIIMLGAIIAQFARIHTGALPPIVTLLLTLVVVWIRRVPESDNPA
jgi:putative oxidoreductase